MKNKTQDNSKLKGRFKITSFKAGTKKVLKQTDWFDNLIPFGVESGAKLVMSHLMGSSKISLEIAIAKLGDNNTAPTDNDTNLLNMLVDNIALATREEGTSSLIFTFFAPDALVPEDDYLEVGIFCDEDEKRMFARAVISPAFTKSTNEDTQIEYTINFLNV